MSAPSSSEVTGLLRAWGRGDEEALQKLMPLVYDQLHAALVVTWPANARDTLSKPLRSFMKHIFG